MPNRLTDRSVKTSPFWWDETPRPALDEAALPARADVVVIGAGYTGLSAALQTARAGRHTVLLDAEAAGWGCSTRNGGQISTSIKPDYDRLRLRHGEARARAILDEGRASLAFIERFVVDERIDCGFRKSGKFIGAHRPAEFERLARTIAPPAAGFASDAYLVPRAEQASEIDSDFYHGGIVYPGFASVDPARLHRGLLDRVIDAGAAVITHCPATAITRDGDETRIDTPHGAIRARDLVLATNGYTGKPTPWLRRRVIPIGSYIVATEALPAGQVEQLIPANRMLGDTRRLVVYYRTSPDGRRLLFGGRVSLAETDPLISGARLRDDLVRIFPQMAGVRISHSWLGFVAYTFDELPHVGRHDGIYYAMGYCGSGVGMACHLGRRIGQQVLGLDEGRTALDGLAFETRPFYSGRPWFLAPSVAYYRWRDRLPW